MSGWVIDPRARVLYVVAVAIGAFLLPGLGPVAALAALQCVLWAVVGLGPRALVGQITRLWFFAFFILLSYALVAQNPETDRWVGIPFGALAFQINVTGAETGLGMVLRIVTVVLASHIARAGDARALSMGLRGLGAPLTLALSIDTVLALFGGAGAGRRGGGGGGGGGGGRRQREAGLAAGTDAPEGFWAVLRRLGRGDVDPLVQRLEQQIARAEAYASQQDLRGAPATLAGDIGAIAGISLTMLGIRALRILPSVPIASGHKMVILTPLYVLAALLTRGRFGSTLTGASMGTVSFLWGSGRYGVFEIAKHVVPGIICDLGLPLLMHSGRVPGGFTWACFGGVVGAGRFATLFAMTWLVQAPAVAYMILLPGLAMHVSFGLLSGYLTYHMVRRVWERKAEAEIEADEVIG